MRACKNKQHPQSLPGYRVQDGYKDFDKARNIVVVKTDWNPIPCGYARKDRDKDPECAGCKWRDWDHKTEK